MDLGVQDSRVLGSTLAPKWSLPYQRMGHRDTQLQSNHDVKCHGDPKEDRQRVEWSIMPPQTPSYRPALR